MKGTASPELPDCIAAIEESEAVRVETDEGIEFEAYVIEVGCECEGAIGGDPARPKRWSLSAPMEVFEETNDVSERAYPTAYISAEWHYRRGWDDPEVTIEVVPDGVEQGDDDFFERLVLESFGEVESVETLE